MSRLTRLSALALLLSAGGCAALRTVPPERDATLRLAQGMAALEAERFNEAFDQLAWVYTHCAGREAGLHATVAMAALELDPRHPTGRPPVGMQLLASLILDPTTPTWVRQIARTSYLLSVGLGAPPLTGAASPADLPTGDQPPPQAVSPAPDGGARQASAVGLVARRASPEREEAYGCGPVLRETGPSPTTLPTLPGPSLAAMLAEVEADRDAQATRAAEMLEELTRLRRELTETRAELERIRRTLRP